MIREGVLHFLSVPGGRLQGRIRVPGDKSISHRAVMLAAIAEGPSTISGFLDGEDTLATMGAFRAMGVDVRRPSAGTVRVQGVGMHGLHPPAGPLYLGNSGTSMRLLAGLLAGQAFDVELTGDASLSRRPMRRVVEPLGLMGGRLKCSAEGTPPVKVHGADLHGIDYQLPVASAQVKSCLLLAGLYARGRTCITEPAPSRDHSERMLAQFGYPLELAPPRVCLEGGGRLSGCTVEVPADLSSAAFFMVGAAIAPGSDILLEQVGINPTRTGILEVLRLMGADITLEQRRVDAPEPVADIRIRASRLRGAEIPPELVPLAIDEFPAIFIAAACADGETRVSGAAELRVKESDRIEVMAEGLKALGIEAHPTADGMVIRGGRLRGGTVHSHGDHRVAMAFSVGALAAEGPVEVLDCDNVDTSFPDFVETAQAAGLGISARRTPGDA